MQTILELIDKFYLSKYDIKIELDGIKLSHLETKNTITFDEFVELICKTFGIKFAKELKAWRDEQVAELVNKFRDKLEGFTVRTYGGGWEIIDEDGEVYSDVNILNNLKVGDRDKSHKLLDDWLIDKKIEATMKEMNL